MNVYIKALRAPFLAGSFIGSAFALGFPHGFFIAAVIWINQFPDYEADRDVGKKNLVVRLGPKLSRYPYCICTCIQGDENSMERISLI